MNINRLAEVFHGHRGALDVPARTPGSNRRFPELFAGLRRFPEREVARVGFIIAIHVNSRARLNSGDINVRELAVGRKLRNSIINRAFAWVGVSLLLQPLD
jgi:hypothetical protein